MSRVLAITLNPAIDLSIGLAQLVPGSVHRGERAQSAAAGKGHNVARVLAAAGHDVTVAGFLGASNAGLFDTAFAAVGIIDRCTRVAGETRTNVKLSEADGPVTEINTPGPSIDAKAWSALRADIQTACQAGPEAIVLAGSLPPGVTPRAFGALVEALVSAGWPVWLDSSGAALAAGVAAGPAMAKPNGDELVAWATAERLADPEDERAVIAAARAMQSAGLGDVVVSRGSARLLWLAGDTVLAARPPRVQAVNTVCAGDTLLAGLLHGRLSGWSDTDTLRYATALSADAVRRVGVGRADAPDFHDLAAAVDIDNLSVPAGDPAARRGKRS